MDFFEQANKALEKLNANERTIFDFVIRDINSVKNMTIRELADRCFVSTTTIIRFCKKLGFEGYREFAESLRIASLLTSETSIPSVLSRRTYYEEYAKNMLESMRVISNEKIDTFRKAIKKNTRIYVYGNDIDYEPAHYCYCIFSSVGLNTYLATEQYERRTTLNQISDDDMLVIFSLNGNDKNAIKLIEDARKKCKVTVTTFTQSANNPIQSLSDIDLYVFSDPVIYQSVDLSSRVSMFGIVELLAYSLINNNTVNNKVTK
ncbi:MAG: MurR/RpiR family transcriptional regulator [Erysipelotrichaceae bacterium]|nr:MurR/RpiR family transcriptional regulator [Erysipelotrichaceae bacterium]